MVHDTTLSESQIEMLLQIILKEIKTNIQHIASVYNIVADMIRKLSSVSIDKVEYITNRSQSWADKLFTNSLVQNNKDHFPLDILIIQIGQQIYLWNRNSKISAYMKDQRSVYSYQALESVKIICYDSKIYALKNVTDMCYISTIFN